MAQRGIFRHPAAASVVLAAVVCLVVAGLAWSGLLEAVELQGYDLLVAARGFSAPPESLAIVDFDDASMAAIGTFPIPRGVLADVVARIASAEPDLIGLDVLLSEHRVPADDQKLAAAIQQAGNVIIVDNFGSEHLPASEPLPEFRRVALDVAFVNLPLDSDGTIRRFFPAMRAANFQGLSLPTALASNHLQQPLQPAQAGAFRLGSVEIPLDGSAPNSALIGAWSQPAAYIVPVRRLLALDFDARTLKGKIVLVGQSSAAGKDLYATPVFRFRKPGEGRALLSGTEIHAAALATLLTGKTIRVMDARWLWLLNFALVWVVTAMVVSTRPQYSIPAVVAGVLGTYFVAQALFSGQQVWMKFISTEAAILFALPAGLGYRFLEERRLKAHAEAERHAVMNLFERYVSPEVAAEIWRRRDEIVLAGQERTATVLFSDIRNFTALTAGKPSADVLAWLNNYFTAMSEVIKRHGGFLNKFIGDGMLVVFGVPLGDGVERDACAAVRAALEMVERVEQLNAALREGEPRLHIGVGLHTGPLTAGNVGARDRLEYSVIGETVNLASRLEALTKDFKTSIVLSPQTHALVEPHFATAPLGETLVRGFPDKIRVYTVTTSPTGTAHVPRLRDAPGGMQ